MRKLTKKIYGALLAGLALTVPFAAAAQSQINSGLGKVGSSFPTIFGVSSGSTVTDLIVFIIRILLAIGGAIAVLFVIIGGYRYITSAGNEEQAEKGKNTLVNAIIGVVLIILAYVIINVIVNTISTGSFFG